MTAEEVTITAAVETMTVTETVVDLTVGGADMDKLHARLKEVVFSPSKVEYEQDTYLRVTATTLTDLYDLLSCCLRAGYAVDAPLLDEVTIHVHSRSEGKLE